MSKKPGSSGLPAGLPEDFFDTDKKSKKAQEDALAKELEQFEQEMAALEADTEEQLKNEFEKLQGERNLDELDQQINQWKRIIELERKAEELKNKPISENPTKKMKTDTVELDATNKKAFNEDDGDMDDIEDFEDKLFNWRSKAL